MAKSPSKPEAKKTAAIQPATGKGKGTRADPWQLQTPSLSSEFAAFRDEGLDPPALVVQVGKTELRYHLRCIEDLHAMLKVHGDWMALGTADEQKPAADGSVEAWGRSATNPIGGWYGLKKGLRGRFGNYVPPVMECSAWPRSNTTPRTTACARNKRHATGTRDAIRPHQSRQRQNPAPFPHYQRDNLGYPSWRPE